MSFIRVIYLMQQLTCQPEHQRSLESVMRASPLSVHGISVVCKHAQQNLNPTITWSQPAF